jgi:phytoene dehydrogenase-like protein
VKLPDAVVVGSGPNGLAAAVTLARAGLAVEVLEGRDTPGGGCRTEAITLPGFTHDICSSVHPLLVASPFFKGIDMPGRGVTMRSTGVAFAHPLDGGRAAAVVASVDQTAAGLGADASAYRRLFGPLVRSTDPVLEAVLSPLRSVPADPLALTRFGALGLLPARILARRFATEEARGLLAGVAAHSVLPLDAPLSGAFALLLTMLAHSVGWPVVEGGSAAIAGALIAELESAGGRVTTGRWVRSLAELPTSAVVLLDVTPRRFVDIAGPALGSRDRRSLARFRYGPGVCKVDWALDGAVPWAAEACRRTATVHVGGTLAEVGWSESEVAAGRHPDRPFCIVVQPGVADPTRAPPGQQTLWAYCHVPSGSAVDMSDRIEAQIERFAPGFRDLILGRVTATAAQVEDQNPNYVGGDINSGLATLRQTIGRPALRWDPFTTGIDGVYLCSASTPPGGGVHGMCGYGAAQSALRRLGLGEH